MKEKYCNDIKDYLKLFSIPNFTANDFAKLFVAILVEDRRTNFKRNDAIDFLYKAKQEEEYGELLKDVKFKDIGIGVYSDSLEEAFNNMKFANMLYTISPEKDDTIFIEDHFNYSGIIEQNHEYVGSMRDLVSVYLRGNNVKYLKKEVINNEIRKY